MRDIFLLGAERSGSTWLANIFDAHPAVELLMEPFADYADLFPEIEGRNSYVAEASPGDCEALEDGYARLAAYKYPLLYRPGRPVWLWRAEERAASALRRASHAALGRSWPRQDRYQLLHLNSSATPMARLSRKQVQPCVRVTKELRLNFKLPLLRAAFPAARFIVVLRHPAAQISSIERWMQRGRLVELARALNSLDTQISQHARFANLAHACGPRRSSDGVEEMLARWWAVNYSVLLEDLDRSGASYQVVRHERLAENPSREVARLLDFSWLKRDPAVDRYVRWSSETAAGRDSPTLTVRHSSEASLSGIRGASARCTAAIGRVLDRLAEAKSLHEQIAVYLPELDV